MFPPLVALLPPFVILWIAAHVAARSRLGEIARFVVAAPAMLLANYVWAVGLMVEIATAPPETSPGLRQAAGT
jgi:hypothetical protein